jgi:DNA topoisomerase 2-associated protein PAT1
MLEQERDRRLQEAQLQEQMRLLRELQLKEAQLKEAQLQELQMQELQLQEQQSRIDHMERQIRSQRPDARQHQIVQNQYLHQRQPSDHSLPGVLSQQQFVQRRQQSPAFVDPHLQPQYQQKGQYVPQNIQLQQRLLSEMAQVEFMRDMQVSSQAEQDALQAEAMRRIMETERMEEKRRRKAAKIAHMACFVSSHRFLYAYFFPSVSV